jgi:nucleotide-binding universal stress UspA family protein
MSTIVVGVDGSDNSRQALEWALEEARAHGGRLEAVHATVDPQSVMPYTVEEVGGRIDAQRTRAAAERMIADLLDEVGVPDGVTVDPVVADGPAANALVERSKNASLLVVGTRGHGGLSEVLLGSVSHQCVHHAHCPVVVVRGKG